MIYLKFVEGSNQYWRNILQDTLIPCTIFINIFPWWWDLKISLNDEIETVTS